VGWTDFADQDAMREEATLPGIDATPRYRAFISYSHADARWGRRLIRKLEGYRLPATLAGTPNRAGQPLERRLGKVFRDRDEMDTSKSLSESIRRALERSEHLIVICSPRSAASSYVNDEIVAFRRLSGGDRTHAFIVSGEPNASREGGVGQECLPAALRFVVDETGAVTDRRAAEPLAADARRGKDGPRRAVLKVIASLLNVDFDLLWRREERRRRQRQAGAGAGGAAVLAVVAGLGWQAWTGNREATERRRLNEHDAYVATFNLAEASYRDRDPARVLERLTALQPAAGMEDVREFAWHFLWGAYHGERRTIPLNLVADAHQRLVVSPDGATIAVTGDETLILFDVATATERLRFEAHAGERVTGLAFVADGRTLLTAGADARLRLWDPVTGDSLRSLPVDVPAGALFVSRNGARAVTVPFDAAFTLHDLGGGRQVAIERLGGRGAPSAVLVPDAGPIAVAYEGGSLVFHDAIDGQLLPEYTGGRTWRLAAAALSPDQQTIALAFERDTVQVRMFDRRTPDEARVMTVAGNGYREVVDVEFSADGRTLVLATGRPDVSPAQESGFFAWDVASGRVRFALGDEETGYVTLFALAPDGRTIATASADHGIRLWDTATGELRNLLGHHADRVWSIAFSADGRTLATMSADQSVRVWDADPPPDMLPIPYRAPRVTTVAFSPDAGRVATGSEDGTIAVYATGAATPLVMAQAHASEAAHVVFSTDGRLVASSARDGTIEVRNAGTLEPLTSLRGQAGYWSALHFDGRSLVHFARSGGASLEGPGLIHAWALAAGAASTTWTQAGNLFAVSADGRRAATVGGYDDGSGRCELRVHVRDRGAARTLTRCDGGGPFLQQVALSDDGRYLAAGGPDLGVQRPDGRAVSGILLYDLEAGGAPVVLPLDVRHDSDGVLAGLDFSADGRLLASASLADESVQGQAGAAEIAVWRIPDGARVISLIERFDDVCGSGGTSCVRSLRFAGDGRTLLLTRGVPVPQVGATEIVRLDPASGERRAHTVRARVDALAVSGDGDWLATATTAGDAVVLWDANRLVPTGSVGERRAYVADLVFLDEDSIVAATVQADAVLEPRVRLWNVTTGEQLGAPGGAGLPSRGAKLSPDGRTVALQTGDSVVIHELNGRRLAAFAARTPAASIDPISVLPHLSRNGHFVGATAPDSAILFEVAAGTSRRLPGTTFAAFSPDARTAATIGECSVLHVIDVASGRERGQVDHGACIGAVVFTPDGRSVLTANSGGPDYARAHLWDIESRERRARLDGYVAADAVAAFSPDGRTLATAGVGTAIDLWDPANGRRLFTLRTTDSPVTALAFSPGGSTLAAVGPDHIRLWRARAARPTADR
jgi:WD40 repeat protein